MSGIKQRLMQPTGLEFHEKAYEIDKAVWDFIRFEFKNRSTKEDGDKRKNSEKYVSNIPTRYWQTHAVPLHRECWQLISSITMANSVYPATEEDLAERRKHQQDAIGHNANILQLLRLILTEIPSVSANKVSGIAELVTQENDLLRAWKRSSRILGQKKEKAPGDR